MNNRTLDHRSSVGCDKAVYTATKVQRKPHAAIPEGSISKSSFSVLNCLNCLNSIENYNAYMQSNRVDTVMC